MARVNNWGSAVTSIHGSMQPMPYICFGFRPNEQLRALPKLRLLIRHVKLAHAVAGVVEADAHRRPLTLLNLIAERSDTSAVF